MEIPRGFNARGLPIVRDRSYPAPVPGVTFYTVPVQGNIAAEAARNSSRSLNGAVTKAARVSRRNLPLTKVIGVLSALPAPKRVFDKLESGGIYPGWVDTLGNTRTYQSEAVEYYFSSPLFDDEFYEAPKVAKSCNAPLFSVGKWYDVLASNEGKCDSETPSNVVAMEVDDDGEEPEERVVQDDEVEDVDSESGGDVEYGTIGGPPYTKAEGRIEGGMDNDLEDSVR